MRNLFLTLLVCTLFSCSQKQQYDTIIRNGVVYDGNSGEPYKADIGIFQKPPEKRKPMPRGMRWHPVL